MAVAQTIIFDPTKEELAVADCILAISVVGEDPPFSNSTTTHVKSDRRRKRAIRLLTIRTVDPPSRLTPPGVPDFLNTAAGGHASTTSTRTSGEEGAGSGGVWTPPRGGVKRGVVRRMIEMVVGTGEGDPGVAGEVLDGLEGVDVG